MVTKFVNNNQRRNMLCARCRNNNDRFETKLSSQLQLREAKRGFFTLVSGVSKWTFPDAKKKRQLPYMDKRQSLALWSQSSTDQVLLDPEVIPDDIRSELTRLFSINARNAPSTPSDESSKEGTEDISHGISETGKEEKERQEEQNEDSCDSLLSSDLIEFENGSDFNEDDSEEVTEYAYESDTEDDVDIMVTPFEQYLKKVEGKSQNTSKFTSVYSEGDDNEDNVSQTCSSPDEHTSDKGNPSVSELPNKLSTSSGCETSSDKESGEQSRITTGSENTSRDTKSQKSRGKSKKSKKSSTPKRKKRTGKKFRRNKVKPQRSQRNKRGTFPSQAKESTSVKKKSDSQNITEKLKASVVLQLFRNYSKDVFKAKCPQFKFFPELE